MLLDCYYAAVGRMTLISTLVKTGEEGEDLCGAIMLWRSFSRQKSTCHIMKGDTDQKIYVTGTTGLVPH